MASNVQINRWYELTIGDGKTFEAVTITPPIGLSFSVEKSSTALRKQNTGQIEVYNLPESTLKVLQGDYPVAFLKVGYEKGDIITILKGEVISVDTRKQGVDKVTQILIGSGYVEINHKVVKAVIPEGKSVKEVITTLQKEMTGISKGVYSGFNIHKKVLYGYPITGTPRETLDNLSRTYHLDYQIDNDTLYVHDADGTTDENYALAPVIDESSGLIDLPYDTKVNVGKAKKSIDNKAGVHFKILLNPTLQAGSIVRIESETITGWFKISDLKHYGGNRQNDWYTECKCENKNKVNEEQLEDVENGDSVI